MSWAPIVVSVALALVAGTLASVDAAISAFSKARAEELEDEGRGGAGRLAQILEDPAPYLNSVLLVRVLAETSSVVLVALVRRRPRRRVVASAADRGRRSWSWSASS